MSNDMPEQIWAWEEGEAFESVWSNFEPSCDATQYTRTDILEAKIKEQEEIIEEYKKKFCDIDTGGTDYLVARRKVAELSGIPAMAISFDEHLKLIEEFLTQATKED